MSVFLTSLEGRWLDDVKFELLSPLSYRSDLLKDTVIIPRGFVTDFASVPRVPIAYWMFGDRAHHESVLHDFFYQTHQVPKRIADKLFLEAMEARDKSVFVRYPMYWAVALGGDFAYASGPSRLQILNQAMKK